MDTSAVSVWEPTAVHATSAEAKPNPLLLPCCARRRPRLGAAGAALLIEALIASGLLVSLSPKTVRLESPALQVSILAAPASKPEPRPQPHEQIALLKQRLPPVVIAPLINLPVEPVPAPPPDPVAVYRPPAPAAPDGLASFEGRVRAAVQTAVDSHYPPAARMLRQHGQAEVSFNYQDAEVSDARVVQSSGYALLDSAALATVRDARYPPPPPELQQHQLNFIVWVRFRLAGDD